MKFPRALALLGAAGVQAAAGWGRGRGALQGRAGVDGLHPKTNSLSCASLVIATILFAFPCAGHEDEEFGFEFDPPRRWVTIPADPSDVQVVARFVCERRYLARNDLGQLREHTPTITLRWFIPPEEGEVSHPGLIPDYRTYIAPRIESGALRIRDEELFDGEGGSVETFRLVSTGTDLLEAVVYLYERPGLQIAIESYSLNTAWKEIERVVLRSLKSFEWSASPPVLDPRARLEALEFKPLCGGDAEDRGALRKASEEAFHARARATLPKGFKAKDSDSFLVVSDASTKYTEKVTEHCEGIFAWLEENLGFLGPEEVVRRPVLRIFSHKATYDAAVKGRPYSTSRIHTSPELLIYASPHGLGAATMIWVNRRLFWYWLQHKDHEFLLAMPAWVEHGLCNHVQGLVLLSGSELTQVGVDRDLELLQSRSDGGPVAKVADLLRGRTGPASQVLTYVETNALVHFLASEESLTTPPMEGVLVEYLRNLHAAIPEHRAPVEAKAAELVHPTTEAREFQVRGAAWMNAQDALLEDAFFRTFRSWEDHESKKLEKAFGEFID